MMSMNYIYLLIQVMIFNLPAVYPWTCRVVLYLDDDYVGTSWDLTTSSTSTDSWTTSDFTNDEISSYKYYCDNGYSCTFKFCEHSDCTSDGWTFTRSCSPGGSGSASSMPGSAYNDELSEIDVTITATNNPTAIPTSNPTSKPTNNPTDGMKICYFII